MGKPVRMADIAERLDISVVSVSKALAGKPGVSEEMRAKIVTLAREMGYEGIRTAPVPGQRAMWACWLRTVFSLRTPFIPAYTGLWSWPAEERA